MKSRSKRSLFGSARGRLFRESRTRWRGNRKRSQRVRFRRRAAKSTLKSVGQTIWTIAQVAFALGIVAVAVAGVARMWRTQEILRVKAVTFEGDVPAALVTGFPVHRGMKLFSVHSSVLSQEALSRFPELESVIVTRDWRGAVRVKGKFRTATAIAVETERASGIDKDGIVFALPAGVIPDASLPRIAAPTGEGRRDALSALERWRAEAPAFSSLVKEIETDKLRTARVTLTNGAAIEWGPLRNDDVVDRARHALRLLEEFAPNAPTASLRFVTTDRIVMNAHWVRRGTEQHGGTARGKT